MTTAQLRTLVTKWQIRLRLQDWNVKVRFAKKGENVDYWGMIIPVATTKEAVIVIHNPKHVEDRGDDCYEADTEVTVVHELMHMHFAELDFASGSRQEVIEEVIVSHVAQLLVALDRADEYIMYPQNPHRLPKIAGFHKVQAVIGPQIETKAIQVKKP